MNVYVWNDLVCSSTIVLPHIKAISLYCGYYCLSNFGHQRIQSPYLSRRHLQQRFVMLCRHHQRMSWIYGIFIHKGQKAVVAVDRHAGLLSSYYGAEDARFAHAVRVCSSVDWLVVYFLLLGNMNF